MRTNWIDVPDVSEAQTLADGIRAVRKKVGQERNGRPLSHDALAALLSEMTGRPAKRQTVIPWEKDTVPQEQYREALIELGLPASLFPPPNKRGTADLLREFSGELRHLSSRVSRLEQLIDAPPKP